MSWKNDEEWQNEIKGVNCPMCGDMQVERNRHSTLIKELPASYVRLSLNQDYRGRILVILKRHAAELFELSPEELTAYWADVANAARAVHDVVQPAKLFYGVFGSRCPHVHCNILPMYKEDDPHAPITMGLTEHFLAEDEYDRLVTQIREHLV